MSPLEINDKENIKKEIINLINIGISKLKEENVPFSAFHYKLQYFIEKSVLFNLSARREYPAIAKSSKWGDPKIGFLDVVWLDKEDPVVAFEIDSKFYIRSIWKLLNIDADFRFWIYYSEMNEQDRFMLMRADKDKIITLVNIPVQINITEKDIKKLERYNHRRNSGSHNVNETHLITYNYIKEGLGIEEIAINGGYSRDTIVHHICNLIENGYDIDIDRLVSKEKQLIITNASKKLHTTKLIELKENLGTNYSYEDIRITLSKYNLESQSLTD